ncbi:MAG: DegV family protein [Lachnospiraceae bacterium]|nr:DegV family protein [Lachnospiraceae bacterium]
MSYKIVADSCCEFPEGYLSNERIEIVPLSLQVGDYHIQDDEDFDQAEFLKRVAECPDCPKSSCPSPERFMEAYRTEAEHVWVITLTSRLSGTYNSAVLGKNLYEEKYGPKQIYVVDSKSACCGETQIAYKIMELEEQGLPFETIVEQIEKFRDEMETYFVLDNLETLRKNGRLSNVKALVASTLSIKPVMGADDGVIVQRGQSVGMKKALAKMVGLMVSEVKDQEGKILLISHCNAPERARQVKDMLMEKGRFKECRIMNTRGVGSMYANDGGIVVTA